MATAGQVTGTANSLRTTCLLVLDGAGGNISANGQPAAATDGVPVYPSKRQGDAADGICYGGKPSREATLLMKAAVAAAQTGSCSLRLWGYSTALGEWVPVGTGSDATTKGILNGGASIGETKSDKLLHSEPLLLAGHFDRLYIEVLSPTQLTHLEVFVATPISVGY